MRIARLGDHIKQVRGVTYQSGDAIESPSDGYIPILRSNNIEEGALNFEGLVYVPEALVKEHQKLKTGDLLLTASTGSKKVIGKNGASLQDLEASFGAFCKVVRAKDSIDKGYLKHFFQTPYYRQTIQDAVNGANINNIKSEHIDDLKILLPPLATQKKVAAILDAADAHRQKTKQLLSKYDELAQSIFLDMFGDPVTNPKGWEVKKMKDITSKIMSGNTPKGGKEVYVEKGILFLRSQNVWRNKLDLEDVAFIDEETHQKMKRSTLMDGDILMTKTGRFNTENSSLGRAAMFRGKDGSANVNGHVYFMRPKVGINRDFVLYILTTIQYREYIRRICVGGIDKRQLNKDHLEDFPIIYPKRELQDSFTEKLKLINQQKEILEKEFSHSNNLFNGLLQKAFKGKLVK